MTPSLSARWFRGHGALLGLIVAASALLAVVPGTGQAQISSPALTFSGSTPVGVNANFTLGYSFDVTVSTGILVTGLSVYDFDSNGLFDSHAVGLWDSAGTLLASATVPAGTAAPLDSGGFRYVTLATPLLLAPGTNYAVGSVFLAFRGDSHAIDLTGLSTAPGVAYGQTRFGQSGASTALVFPTSTDSRSGTPGGSFEVVPEPSTYILLALGVMVAAGSLVQRRHRHRRGRLVPGV